MISHANSTSIPRSALKSGLRSAPAGDVLGRRIVAGVLYAAARHLPVPLADDMLRERIARWMLEQSLPGESRNLADHLIAPGGGLVRSALGSILRYPMRLVLAPVRTAMAFAFGAQWLANDLAEMVLLGRVVDHAVAVGLFATHREMSAEQLAANAHRVRQAFDAAMGQTRISLLAATLATAIAPFKSFAGLASSLWERAARKDESEARQSGEAGARAPRKSRQSRELEGLTERVRQALLQPEARRFLARFDEIVLAQLESNARQP